MISFAWRHEEGIKPQVKLSHRIRKKKKKVLANQRLVNVRMNDKDIFTTVHQHNPLRFQMKELMIYLRWFNWHESCAPYLLIAITVIVSFITTIEEDALISTANSE